MFCRQFPNFELLILSHRQEPSIRVEGKIICAYTRINVERLNDLPSRQIPQFRVAREHRHSLPIRAGHGASYVPGSQGRWP